MDRRGFLATSGAMLAAACGSKAPAPAQLHRWGLQLFTVGTLLEADFEGTLRQVAALGYKEVETIGSFGRDPAYVRAQLDRFGLTSPSQHFASDALYNTFRAFTERKISSAEVNAAYNAALAPDNLLAQVRDAIPKAKALGQSYVTQAILEPPMLASRDILGRNLTAFNEAGRICHEEGLTFAFHNHADEFGKLGSDTIYDLILEGTDPELVKMELDFYWISKAGHDPLAYLAANPGRFFGCHVKDMDAHGDFAAAGSGTLNLPPMIDAARKSGAKHFYVEIDRAGDPMKVTADSIGYLSKLP